MKTVVLCSNPGTPGSHAVVLGGLGIRQLQVQNSCLLLKLLHRLHHPSGSAWATWARERVRLHSLQGEVEGSHWDALRNLLPAYRCITRVQLGDG